jgi:hypothetical protein
MKYFMKKSIVLLGITLALILFSCKNVETKNAQPTNKIIKKAPVRKAPKAVTYTLENTKDWLKINKDAADLEIALAINRTDKQFFVKMDSVIIPADLSSDISFYLPFPVEVPYLTDVDKILFFSYPTQTFAAYENGILIYPKLRNRNIEFKIISFRIVPKSIKPRPSFFV